MDQPDPERERTHLRGDQSDQLSPSRALRESLGSSDSQRVGDNGPLANPVVSFPEAADDEPPAEEEKGS
jgi:hypothetical protein